MRNVMVMSDKISTVNSEISKVRKVYRALSVMIGIITTYLLVEDMVFLLLNHDIFDVLEFRLFRYLEISIAYSVVTIVALLVSMARALWIRKDREWVRYMVVLAVVVLLKVLEILYFRNVVH